MLVGFGLFVFGQEERGLLRVPTPMQHLAEGLWCLWLAALRESLQG